MNELLEQLQMKMEAFQKDAALQAEKGNKAAGQRARCVSLPEAVQEAFVGGFEKIKSLDACNCISYKRQLQAIY